MGANICWWAVKPTSGEAGKESDEIYQVESWDIWVPGLFRSRSACHFRRSWALRLSRICHHVVWTDLYMLYSTNILPACPIRVKKSGKEPQCSSTSCIKTRKQAERKCTNCTVSEVQKHKNNQTKRLRTCQMKMDSDVITRMPRVVSMQQFDSQTSFWKKHMAPMAFSA